MMAFQKLARFTHFGVNNRRFLKMDHITQIKTEMQSFFEKSVIAVQPHTLLKNVIHVKDDTLHVCNRCYTLNKNAYMIGFGKAVLGMACEAERLLGNHLVSGIISVPEGIQEAMKNIPSMQPEQNTILEILEGARNNLPDKNSEKAARKIKQLVQNLNSSDLLLVLISGGGSALLPLPVPPITLEEKCQVVKILAAAGANIGELNCVRKKLSLLKGGGLARLAFPAQVEALILSDIVGDPLDLIASGPTVVNNDAPGDAFNILKKYSLLGKVPSSVGKCLESTDDIKYKDQAMGNSKNFPHVHNVLIGSNLTAVTAAAKAASSCGYIAVILSTRIEGLVSDVGKMYATLSSCICKAINNNNTLEVYENFKVIKQTYNMSDNAEEEILAGLQNIQNKKGLCLIAGGETTVVVKGHGLGGRNQELAMIFAGYMNENSKLHPFLEEFHTVLLSAGTDGIDGPTAAAGAFGYEDQIHLAKTQKLDPYEFEVNNDSYNFYSKLNNGGDLVVCGHTGTNVMDVHILVVKPK